MMDTLGAIVGPASAFFLLQAVNHHYPVLFALTLIPGLMAVGLMAFVVKEKDRAPVPHTGFGESLRALPPRFQKFLVAVGLFGAGDFAHTMLILLAAQKLAPTLGAAKAASIATGLYVLHNVLYASFAFIAGWLADHFDKGRLLAAGYFIAALMALAVILLPMNVWTLAVIFALGGIYVAIEETLEDSFCAELVGKEHHGMAFGTLATVNGIGDFASSLLVGLLWTAFGTQVAFAYSAVLFIAGSWLVSKTAKPG
jgi:MFS family permease